MISLLSCGGPIYSTTVLKVVWLSELSQKNQLWERFDPRKSFWIVSDLKSKVFLNRRLLDRFSILADEPVRRASELWRDLSTKVNSEIKILGPLGVKARARRFLKEPGLADWCSRPRAAELLLR